MIHRYKESFFFGLNSAVAEEGDMKIALAVWIKTVVWGVELKWFS